MASDSNTSDRKEALLIFLGIAAALAGSYVATNYCLLCEVSPSLFFIEALALLFGSMFCWSLVATRAECIARTKRNQFLNSLAVIRHYSALAILFVLMNCLDFFFRVSSILAGLDSRHVLLAGAFLAAKAVTVGWAIEVISWTKGVENER